MALMSLKDLCLIKIQNYIGQSKIHDFSNICPPLRQQILTNVLSSGKIDENPYISALSSPEFLCSMESLDTQHGNSKDDSYLYCVSKSLATIQSDGSTIGDGIFRLRLHCYFDSTILWNGTLVTRCLNSIIINRLISQCCNLNILDIRMQKVAQKAHTLCTEAGQLRSLSISEKLQPHLHTLKNLEQFSFTGGEDASYIYPLENLANLKLLTLINTRIDNDDLCNFQKIAQSTLTELIIDNVKEESDVELKVPHVPLLNLKRLKISRTKINLCVENLIRCTNLEEVHLPLDSASITKQELYVLAEIPAKMTFEFSHMESSMVSESQFDESSNLYLISHMLGDKITHLNLTVKSWTDHFASAFEDMVEVCLNLNSLHLHARQQGRNDKWRRVMSAMEKIFNDEERAMKMSNIYLEGQIDSDLEDIIRKNCRNLQSLHMEDERLVEIYRIFDLFEFRMPMMLPFPSLSNLLFLDRELQQLNQHLSANSMLLRFRFRTRPEPERQPVSMPVPRFLRSSRLHPAPKPVFQVASQCRPKARKLRDSHFGRKY